MKGMAGQIKPSGLGLNLQSVQLKREEGSKSQQQEDGGEGQTPGHRQAEHTCAPTSGDSEGRARVGGAGGKGTPLGDWRCSAGKETASRICTVILTGQGHLPPLTWGQTCSGQWFQTPDPRPQTSEQWGEVKGSRPQLKVRNINIHRT